MASPLDQFKIQEVVPLNVAGFDIGLTNSTIWMLIVLGAIYVFMMGGLKGQLIPGRWQAAVEGLHGFVTNLIDQNIGKEGRQFIPLVFSLFVFIIACNIIGLLPTGVIPGAHPFTVTSHLTITAVLGISVFLIVVATGLARHGLHFFSLFVPAGVPWWMMPIIVPVELVSFLVRPFSLALRLFVAMTAGHILLKVAAGFVVDLGNAGAFAAIAWLPFLLLLGISALEILVAMIQAYVFALLTTLYLNDAVHLHDH